MSTITPVRGFDITILFDRYISSEILNIWDGPAWDSEPWDGFEGTDSFVYVHTTVNATLGVAGPTVSVDDITYLTSTYLNDVKTPVSIDNPLTINLGTSTYQIGTVVFDAVNISTTNHGFSGKLTTVSGNISPSDATFGNVVEAVTPQPTAAARILDWYVPTAEMPPLDLTLLLDLGMQGTTLVYPTTTAVTGVQFSAVGSISGTVLTISSISSGIIQPGQTISGVLVTSGTTIVSNGTWYRWFGYIYDIIVSSSSFDCYNWCLHCFDICFYERNCDWLADKWSEHC